MFYSTENWCKIIIDKLKKPRMQNETISVNIFPADDLVT